MWPSSKGLLLLQRLNGAEHSEPVPPGALLLSTGSWGPIGLGLVLSIFCVSGRSFSRAVKLRRSLTSLYFHDGP